jgi:hypothetical protein
MIESIVDDAYFDLLDSDRWLIDAQHTCILAWGGTNPAGEFWKIISGMKAVNRLPSPAAMGEVVPFRY